MKKENPYSDAQLDDIIRSAWQLEDELKTASLSMQPEDALPPVDEMTVKRAFVRAQQAADERRRQARSRKIRKILRRCVNTAAAVVLTAVIGLSAALATSESFRAEALRLLVSFDAQSGIVQLTLIKPDVAAMQIPDAWTGSFYPAALPEGVRMTDCRMWSRGGNHEITFETQSGGKIVFSELHGNVSASYSLESATVSYMEVNGDTAFVRYLADTGAVGVDWANDVCWLALYTEGMTVEETLEIARSVIYIK